MNNQITSVLNFITFLFLENNLGEKVNIIKSNSEIKSDIYLNDKIVSRDQLIYTYKKRYSILSQDDFRRLMAIPYLITTGKSSHLRTTPIDILEVLENFFPVQGIGFVQIDFYNYSYEYNNDLLVSNKKVNFKLLISMVDSLIETGYLNNFFNNIEILAEVEKIVQSINKNKQYITSESDSLFNVNMDNLLCWAIDYSIFKSTYIKYAITVDKHQHIELHDKRHGIKNIEIVNHIKAKIPISSFILKGNPKEYILAKPKYINTDLLTG
jgi:hypothetical protein